MRATPSPETGRKPSSATGAQLPAPPQPARLYPLLRSSPAGLPGYIYHGLSWRLRRSLKQGYCFVRDAFYRTQAPRLRRELEAIQDHNPQARQTVVFLPSVEWNISLFQRPQQLALALARQGCLVFFWEPLHFAQFRLGVHPLAERLFALRVPPQVLEVVRDPVAFTLVYNDRYLQHLRDARVVYEYIDELDVFPEALETLRANHTRLLQSADVVVATADRLFEQVVAGRPDALLCPNAVDYHFIRAGIGQARQPPQVLAPVLQAGRPVVGYYGALAQWFDYPLLVQVARACPEYQFVLIGPDYDDSRAQAGLSAVENIHWLGPQPHAEIPRFLKHFDVAVIPFLLNEITHATSPLKLFEFMAGGKPVVTTAMHECSRYPGVLVAGDAADFAGKLDQALALRADPEYLATLDRTARANTWDARACALLAALEARGRPPVAPDPPSPEGG